MINIKSIAIAALMIGAAVLPLSAVAQGRGQGGGQGQTRGGGMQFGGQRGGVQQSKGFLLVRNDVRKDLKTTADQNTKIDAAVKALQDSMPSFGGGAGGGQRGQGGGGGQAAGGQRPDMQAIQEQMAAAMKKFDEDTTKILDEKQKARLDQIQLQMSGNRALMQEDLQKKLEFTKDQTRKVQDLEESMNTANQAIFERMRNGEIERTELQPLMEENNKILDQELAKVLTSDQTKKFDEMKGAKFTRDPKDDEAARGLMGRGGRGGGGGN